MANIDQNTTYSGSNSSPAFRPSMRYSNLAEMKRQGGSPFAPQELQPTGTPEYYQGIKEAMVNQYGAQANVKTAEQFKPPEDPNVPLPIPSDYSGFQPAGSVGDPQAGSSLSWADPVSPVIQNMPGDVPGQFVQDTANPDSLIKSVRGYNQQENKAILQGRPSFLYQIDHIIPLALGGADTMGNREVLTMDQNNKKTIAQAVPYTLYAHGQLSLKEARDMAMQWQNRDITDLPQPDRYGLLPLDKAKLAQDIWSKPHVDTLKEKIGKIPQVMKDFGKGWLPDGVREFVKGAASGATMGFLPYAQGEDEGTGEKIAGWAGMLAGGVASFVLGGWLIDGALAIGGLARGAIGALRGVAALRGAEAGFGAIEGAAAIANEARAIGSVAGEIANTAKFAGKAATTFKSLNVPPTYLQQLITKPNLLRAGKIGVQNALVMEGNRLVENHLHPEILSGQRAGTTEEHQIAKIFADLSIGAISGIASPTLKGAALAAGLPMTISYISDPEHPIEALTNGVIFGAMHMAGAGGKRKQMNAVIEAFEETANKAAYSSLGYYAPDILPKLAPGELVPSAAKVEALVQQAKSKAVNNLWKRFYFDQNPDGTPATGGMTLADANKELQRITASARQLYKSGLATEMRGKADIDDLLSFGKMAKNPSVKGAASSNLQNRFDTMSQFSKPSIAVKMADSLDDAMFTKSFSDSNKVPASGKYLTGDIALTGAGLSANTPEAVYFFQQKALGNASPKILLVDRSDTAPVWRMKNDLLAKEPDLIKSGRYALDPNPENSLQAFGIIRDPETGAKSLINLGWVASDHRLNLSTHPQARAFNQHPLVVSGEMSPIGIMKDQLAPKMRQEGVSVLVANLDYRATPMTKEGQLPFIPVNINDVNWAESKKLVASLSSKEQGAIQSTLQKDIADVNHAVTSKGLSEKVARVREKVKDKASTVIPKTSTGTSRGALEQETARSLFDDMATVNSARTTAEVKDAANRIFGAVLSEEEAQKILMSKGTGSTQQDLQLLTNVAKEGRAAPGTVVRLKLAKPYLESDTFKTSPIAKSFPSLRTTGGIEDYPVPEMTQPAVTPTAVQSSSAITNIENPKIPVQNNRQPVKIYDPITKQNPVNSTRIAPPEGGLHDRIVATAAREKQTIGGGKAGKDMVADLAQPYIAQYQGVIDEAVPRGTGLYQMKNYESIHESAIKSATERVQAELQNRGTPQKTINEVKAMVETELRGSSSGRLLTLSRAEDMPDEIPTTKSDPDWLPEQKLTSEELLKEWKDANPKKSVDKFIADLKSDNPSWNENKKSSEDANLSRLISKNLKPQPLGDSPVRSSATWKTINEGLASDKNSPAYTFNYGLDKIMRHLYGPEYQKNVDAARFMSSMSPEGGRYYKSGFLNDINAAGREITQPEDIINARAMGDREAESAARIKRTIRLSESRTGGKGTLDEGAKNKQKGRLNELGMETSDLDGMTVIPEEQELGMIRGLTEGEDQMAAVSSNLPMTNVGAVGDLIRWFTGTGPKSPPGLLKAINEFEVFSGRQKKQIPPALIKELEAMAKKADQYAGSLATSKSEAASELKILKKQYGNISKLFEQYPHEQYLKEGVEDLKAQMQRYEKILGTGKKADGAGGPGYDGRGGPGMKNGSIIGMNMPTTYANSTQSMATPPAMVEMMPMNAAMAQAIIPTVKHPKEFTDSIAEASRHTGISRENVVGQLLAENGSDWNPKLTGRMDPNDRGVSQLNVKFGVPAITGSAGGRNYFKDNYKRHFDINNGQDQVLGYGVLINKYMQFDLPPLLGRKPTLEDAQIAYNMGPTSYANSLKPDAPKELVDKREFYKALLIKNGVNFKAGGLSGWATLRP